MYFVLLKIIYLRIILMIMIKITITINRFEPLHSDSGSVSPAILKTCKSSMSSSVLCVRYVSNCFRFAEFLISIYQTKFNLNEKFCRRQYVILPSL